MFKRLSNPTKAPAPKPVLEVLSSSPSRRKNMSDAGPDTEEKDDRSNWFQTGRPRVASLVNKSHFADRVLGAEETDKVIPHLEGYLYKENRRGKNQKRFFAVNNSYLNYYSRRTGYKQNKVKGSINLIHATTICMLVRNGKPTRRFAIQTEGEEDHEELCLFLKAKTKQAARMWVENLNQRRQFWLGPNAPPEPAPPPMIEADGEEEGWNDDRVGSDDEEDTDEGFESARSREYTAQELAERKARSPGRRSALTYSSSSNEDDSEDEDMLGSSGRLLARKSRSSSTFKYPCEALPEESRLLTVPHQPWASRYWSRPECRKLVVRGPHYLTTKEKIPVGEDPLFECVAVDMFSTHAKIDNICEHPRSRVAQAKLRGEKLPFLFVIQFQIPGPPFYTMVVYLAARHPEIAALLCPSAAKNPPDLSAAFPTGMRQLLLKFFRTGSDEFCNTHFKLIPRIVEGPWIVRNGIPSRPALIGTKLQNSYFRTDEYFELDINIGTNSMVTTLTQLATSYARLITIDLAFLVEAKQAEELPEFIIGIVRCTHIDFRTAIPLEGDLSSSSSS